MSDLSLSGDLLRDVDAILRVVAPTEHPVGASPLVVTFDDCELDADFRPTTEGFFADGLDTFAAWLRQDESLVGRPVVAIAVDRAIRFATIAGEIHHEVALLSVADTALHELAHALGRNLAAPRPAVDPTTFRTWIRDRLSANPGLATDTTSHDANWWKKYVVLTARLATVTPKLYPKEFFAAAAKQYGYGSQDDADAWIVAAKSDPVLLAGSIVDAASRPNPAIDRLLHSNRTRVAETVSVAASQRA